MSTIAGLPNWAEGFHVGDDVFAKAWEDISPHDRSLLKTAIAFQFHLWNTRDYCETREKHSRREGFATKLHSMPAPWVVIILAPGFSSPARLLAALVPAMLAGTSPIIITLSTLPSAVCVSLELAGVEDVFLMDCTNAKSLVATLNAQSEHGCLVLFPWDGSDQPSLSSINETFCGTDQALLKFRTWQDRTHPRFLVRAWPSENDYQELLRNLRWLHPDAVMVSQKDENTADCAFTTDINAPAGAFTKLSLGPGMEACWVGPSPDFFRIQSYAAFLIPEVL